MAEDRRGRRREPLRARRGALAFVGESGSGKTTALASSRASSPHVRDRSSAASRPAARVRAQGAELARHVQMVFQDPYCRSIRTQSVRASIDEVLREHLISTGRRA